MFGVDAIKRILAKMYEYREFGEVEKNGRTISIIDVLIVFDLKAVNFLREKYYEARK